MMKNPAHPGRIIRKEFLEALGVSVAETARRIKVSRQALSSVLNGKADLTADMALRLEKAFGIDMETFLRIQNAYDIAQARRKQERTRLKIERYEPVEPRPAAWKNFSWHAFLVRKSGVRGPASGRDIGIAAHRENPPRGRHGLRLRPSWIQRSDIAVDEYEIRLIPGAGARRQNNNQQQSARLLAQSNPPYN
jgi:antitoxin HigA-1